MPDREEPCSDGLTALAESVTLFAVCRDLAEEVILQLGESPFSKLRGEVLRMAEMHAGPVTAALLKVAKSCGAENPNRQKQLARLALKVAQKTDLPESLKRALFAEAEILVGDGWRRERDFREAERAFVRAARHLEENTDSRVKAFFLVLLAKCREDQQRQEEAFALWERAAFLFGQSGQIDDQAEVLLDKVALELCLGDWESALNDLRTILALTDESLRPDLAAIAVMAYGALLSKIRRTAEALAIIGAFREHYPDFQDHPALAEIDLLEGGLLIFSDRREVAEARLESARREFLRSGRVRASAEACLNLALLFLLDGRRDPDLRNLAEESIEPISHSAELPEEIREALGAFCAAVHTRRATAGFAGALREALQSSKGTFVRVDRRQRGH